LSLPKNVVILRDNKNKSKLACVMRNFDMFIARGNEMDLYFLRNLYVRNTFNGYLKTLYRLQKLLNWIYSCLQDLCLSYV
jgi:hypothetical protein